MFLNVTPGGKNQSEIVNIRYSVNDRSDPLKDQLNKVVSIFSILAKLRLVVQRGLAVWKWSSDSDDSRVFDSVDCVQS